MPLSLAQLLKSQTKEQVTAMLVETLQESGFATASWVEGSIQRNILQSVARVYVDASDTLKTIAENIIVKPTGAWLDLVGLYRFGLPRLPAVATERIANLTSAASAPPHVITDGSYIATSAGVRFRVVGAHNLDPDETIAVPVKAEFAGAAGNVSFTEVLAIGPPAYTGVTAVFPDDELTVTGVDAEKDDRYWLRCQLRYAELTYSYGLRAYELWALTAAPSLRRARAVLNYPDPGDIRLALDPGTAGEIAAVTAYVAGRQHPLDQVTIAAANKINQAIVYAPRVGPGFQVSQANAAIQAMLDSIPIGGVLVSGAIAGRLLRDSIAEVLLCSGTFSVQSVGLSTPAADVVLGATDIVQGLYTCTPESAV